LISSEAKDKNKNSTCIPNFVLRELRTNGNFNFKRKRTVNLGFLHLVAKVLSASGGFALLTTGFAWGTSPNHYYRLELAMVPLPSFWICHWAFVSLTIKIQDIRNNNKGYKTVNLS